VGIPQGWGCFSSNGLWNKPVVKDKALVVDTEKSNGADL